MKIPAFWQRASFTGQDRRGHEQTVSALGWSFRSVDEARHMAQRRAEQLFDILVRQGRSIREYEYADRPIREPIIERYGPEGGESACITRNRYGALVLNSAQVLIADIDFPPARPKGAEWWRILLPGGMRGVRKRVEQEIIEKVCKTLRDQGHNDFRLYRTRAGLRLILTDRLYSPKEPLTDRLLQSLGTDPLYRRLSHNQACFRARLTPKPWRINVRRPPVTWPWLNEQVEHLHNRWESDYQRASEGFAVCRLIEASGREANATIVEVVALHDRYCLGDENAPLA